MVNSCLNIYLDPLYMLFAVSQEQARSTASPRALYFS